jgi:hypothetical protein
MNPATYDDTRQSNGRFGPGNPGKPAGARHRISQRVVTTILADFEKHQDKILRELRVGHIRQYVSLVSRLLPRQALVECVDAEDLGAAEVAAVVAEARAALDRIEAGASFAELDAALAAAPAPDPAPAADHRCNTVEYGAAPTTRLDLEGRPSRDAPSDEHLREAVETLGGDGPSFARLTDPGGAALRVAGGGAACRLERHGADGRRHRAFRYRSRPTLPDGTPLFHAGAEPGPDERLAAGLVAEAFVAFANGQPLPSAIRWRDIIDELRPRDPAAAGGEPPLEYGGIR